MSEKYENNEKSQITIIEILIIAGMALVLLPLLPLNILYIILTSRTNRKENFVLYPSIVIVALLYGKIGIFLEEAVHITIVLVKGLINDHKFNVSAYSHYSLTSWVLLAVVSFIMSAYVIKRIRHNYLLEQLGVNTLNSNIERMGAKRFDKHEYRQKQCYFDRIYPIEKACILR